MSRVFPEGDVPEWLEVVFLDAVEARVNWLEFVEGPDHSKWQEGRELMEVYQAASSAVFYRLLAHSTIVADVTPAATDAINATDATLPR